MKRLDHPRPAVDLAKLPGVVPASAIEPLLGPNDLPGILAISLSTIDRLRSSGRFPKPDKLIGIGSRKMPRWKPETIRKWIDAGGEPCR